MFFIRHFAETSKVMFYQAIHNFNHKSWLSFLQTKVINLSGSNFSMMLSVKLCIIKLVTRIVSQELLISKKSSHAGEASHLIQISAEWCISLCKNKSLVEQIHPTQVRSQLTADEISLKWNGFSPCKQCLLGCLTQTGLFIQFRLGAFL